MASRNRTKPAPELSVEGELLKSLKGLMAASEHMSPFGGTISVKTVRLAGKYMEALESAQRAVARAESQRNG